MSSKSSKTDAGNTETEEEDPLVPAGLLPSYLADAFSDLYSEDGLVVLGKGLGWLSLLAVFVRFYADVEDGHVSIATASGSQSKYCTAPTKEQNGAKLTYPFSSRLEPDKPPLVIVLGLKERERKALGSILESFGTPPELMPTFITNESGQGKDRACELEFLSVLTLLIS